MDSLTKSDSASIGVTTEERHPALRVGMMLDSFVVPKWVHKSILDMEQSGFIVLALIVLNKQSPKQLGFWKKMRKRFDGWSTHGLFDLYERWDYRKNKSPKDAFEEVDLSQELANIPVMHVKPAQTKFVDRFDAADIQAIKSADLDVMIRLGFRIIKGEILNCARHGVWSFHHDDSNEYRGGPPLFWEIYEKNPVSGTILQVLSEKLDGGRVLYRSFSSTEFKSLYLNRNATYWKTGNFLVRSLRELYVSRGKSNAPAPDGPFPPYSKGIYRTPSNLKMARFLARQIAQRLKQKCASLVWEEQIQWFVAFRKRSGGAPWSGSLQGFTILRAPQDRYYADPFLIQRGGKQYLFFEDFQLRQGKAVISYVTLDDGRNHGEPKLALERPYHLSYPFLFEWNEQIYMMPETKQNRSVEIYRAVDFPGVWELTKPIAEGLEGVDATLWRDGDRFWLFLNIAPEGGSTWDELHLYCSESPFGPWRPHAKNPVVSDVRRARPAGNLFVENGQLIRPAQDCSGRYGRAINFNRVLVLSEEEYREEAIGRISPDWIPGNMGTHTYNRSAEFEVVDGQFLRRIPRWSRHRG